MMMIMVVGKVQHLLVCKKISRWRRVKKNDGDETSIGLDGLEGLSRAGNELGFKFRPDRHSSYPGSTYVDRQVMLSSAIRAFKLVRTKKKD